MPRIKVLPHAQICPNGAEFEVEQNANLCESLLTLINKGVVDPVSAHKKICNLDRDEILNE